MAIFVKFADMKGNVTAKGYQEWSEIQHLEFDINRAVSMKVGRKNDRVSNQPNFSHLSIHKQVDNTSHELFQAACKGNTIEKMEIHVCATNKELTPYVKYILNNVIIARHATAIASSGLPTEHLQMHFLQIESHYVGRDAGNKALSPYISGYNLETAEVL